jgi:methylglyoxal synthase
VPAAAAPPRARRTTKKVELLRWAEYNRQALAEHELYAAGTTGTLLEYELGLRVTCFLSGPVAGRPADRGRRARRG